MKNPKHPGGRPSSHKPSSSSATPTTTTTTTTATAPFKPHPTPSNPDIPGPSKPPSAAAAVAAAALPPAFHPSPPPPPYGFHNLDRRTIYLADGTVRSYFALPPDYPTDRNFFRPPPFDPPPFRHQFPEGSSSAAKRRYEEEEEFARHRRHVEEMRPPKQAKLGGDVGGKEVDDAFLRLSKSLSENLGHRKNYLEDGRNGPLQCVVCGRGGKEFADVHGLILHAYNSQNSDLRIDHLGLHKALCVMMGWNHAIAPDNSKDYQSLSADDARENREDLILWPPTVIIHNTSTGKRKDGRMDGLGNKEMDVKLKELGFGGGKAKSVYGKEGHLGFTAVKFSNTEASFREAVNLAEFFEKDNRGRRGWARVQASQSGNNDEKNPDLVKVDKKTGEKNRVFYGYLATTMDLDKVEFDMRKKVVIKSRKELNFD